ncbi:beta-ketoacyl synthase N-terminal-like domain-containing protein [Streptomyces sp. TE33382]
MAAVVAGRFGIGGPGHTLSTACSAGTYAVSWGAELIGTGQADIVIACGGDAFSRVAVGTLHRFGLLDPECCRPFDTDRAGMVTGEGAAAVVLESAESARRRGVTAQAVLAGQGWSCDAHHPMAPEPSGEQLSRSVAQALATTTGTPGAVVLHRAGVALNDSVESTAISEAVAAAGGDAGRIAGYAPKAVMGHTAGAAGVFGCVIAARILRHGLVPPNAHVATVDPASPMAVPLNAPVALDRPSVLVSGTGFGGNNAVLAWEAAG